MTLLIVLSCGTAFTLRNLGSWICYVTVRSTRNGSAGVPIER
jgi:hypothetical protein